MFKNKFFQIYVTCPASFRTGGVELLHQLVYTLNQLGANATIAYTNIPRGEDPTNTAYKKYVDRYVSFSEIKDESSTLVIISEHQVELVSGFIKAEVAVWWLSVDNYQKVYNPLIAFKLLGAKGVVWYFKHARWRYRVSKINKVVKYNLAQSYYAIDFLNNNGFLNVDYLSDYINTDYLQVTLDKKDPRNNVVLYNPKKGKKFSNYLKTLDKNIQWVPLINLTNQQVRELLLTSKVYIDFGNHPGKDRFPREAAICGCCVITDRRGSAKYYKDVPILDRYKYEDKRQYGSEILQCVRYCFNNYESCFDDFSDYRAMIAREKKQFENDVKRVFFD